MGSADLGGGNARMGFEDGEFPIVCESCLGDNPYLRMQKEEHAGTCKMCERAFTLFRWKPGRKSAYIKTEVCQSCAKIKNQCQTCILDLKYGLPSQLRDAVMDGKPGGMQLAISDGQQHYQQSQALSLMGANVLSSPSDGLVDHIRNEVAQGPQLNRKIKHIASGPYDKTKNKRSIDAIQDITTLTSTTTNTNTQSVPPPAPPLPPKPSGAPPAWTFKKKKKKKKDKESVTNE